jgi:SanA protein
VIAVIVGAAAVAGPWFAIESEAGARIFTSLDALAPQSAGLVLGTSKLLRGHFPNPYFRNRIAAAAALFAAGKVKYLIVSGNQARGGRAAGGYDEPTDMRDALVAAGVPSNRIYRDYAGFRTLDSVLRAKSVFGQDSVIVVSQHFHLARALFLADHNGLTFEGWEAADAPLRFGVRTKIREMGARMWAYVDVALGRGARFGGKPVRLGVDSPT